MYKTNLSNNLKHSRNGTSIQSLRNVMLNKLLSEDWEHIILTPP